MTEENIIPSGAFKEFYSGAPIYRDHNNKTWVVNERGEPVPLGAGATPQPRQFDVHELPLAAKSALRYWITNEFGETEWISSNYVLTNIPIPHIVPPQFEGWFVTSDGLRVVAPVPPEPATAGQDVGVHGRYQILAAQNIVTLEGLVNREMVLGGNPLGGVAVDKDDWLYQAMVKLP